MVGKSKSHYAASKSYPPNGGPPARSRVRLFRSLLATLAVLLIVGLIVSRLDKSRNAGFEPAERKSLFPQLAERMDDVQSVEIIVPAERYHLKKSRKGWRLIERDGYPIPGDNVTEFLESFAGMSALYVSKGGERSSTDYGVARTGESKVGVGTMVTVLDKAGSHLAQATLGYAVSVPGDARKLLAARREDSSRIWMVDGNIKIPGMPVDWLERDLVDIPRDAVAKFTIVPPNDRSVVIERTGDNDLVVKKGLSTKEELRGPWVLDRLVAAFENLTFVDVRTAVGIDAFDREPWQSELVTKNGLAYKVDLFRIESADWAIFSASARDKKLAHDAKTFNTRHTAWAYRLPFPVTSRLRTEADQLVK